MIRIKDSIFNENRIVQMCINENNNLEIDTDNGFPIVIKDATFEDIEWNYEDKQIRKCLESIDREKELEEENERLESYISCGWNGTCKDLERNELFNDLQKIGTKINEIIDKINGGE